MDFNHSTLIDRTQPAQQRSASPGVYGFETLHATLQATDTSVTVQRHLQETSDGLVIAAGTTADQLIRRLLAQAGANVPSQPESVVYHWAETAQGRVLVAAGTDARGLLYALLELADTVRCDGLAALAQVQNQIESPDHRIRGLDRFIMGPMDDEWFYSDAFWTYYLDRLAHSRFNRFVLVTGFDTAYLSPPYSYFVQTPDYPQARVRGLDEAGMTRNLEQLRYIGRECHRRGLEFIFGTWQQTPWTANQQGQVEGLPGDEEGLSAYCAAGVKALVQQCEEIDGIHFRVNHEAGVGTQKSNEAFWLRLIDAVADCGRPVKLDLRAKGLTDHMIQHALDLGLDVAVPTKYWCEHTGLPHHLTQMRREELTQLDNLNHSRRYSYADLLRKPHWYDVIYRLWTLGSTTLFLWGDPDYVRRFSASCQVGNAAGYEVAAPLSMKGGHAAMQTGSWPIFDNPSLQMGRWEDERHWLFYLLYGRIGYSSHTAARIWQRELRTRFGHAAQPLEQALRAASKILPLVTAAHMPVHPMLHYWPELSTGAALFAENNHNPHFNRGFYGQVSYGSAEPGDGGLFYSIDEYVRARSQGAITGKYTPQQVAAWLGDFAAETKAAIEAADGLINDAAQAEYQAMRLDLLMLADLASYHVDKIRAALALAQWHSTNQARYLTTALSCAVAARRSWAALAERALGAYHQPLEFSAGHSLAKNGHWQDYLPELDADIAKLDMMLRAGKAESRASAAEADVQDYMSQLVLPLVNVPLLHTELPQCWQAGQDLPIVVKCTGAARFVHGPTLHYRHTNQLEGAFQTIEMERMDTGFSAVIPGAYLQPEWDLLVYISAALEESALIVPGLYHPVHPLPYFVVSVDDE